MPKRKSKGLQVIERLRRIFKNRPRGRDGMLVYLTAVYKAIRKHRSWIRADIDLQLTRNPRSTSLFANMIEVTSPLIPKVRSKYAKVLEFADKRGIKANSFWAFVKETGGYNAVIKKPATKPKKSPARIPWS